MHHNGVSYAGSLVAGAGFVLLLAVAGVRFSLAPASPYLGIVAFLVCPAIVLLGAAIYLVPKAGRSSGAHIGPQRPTSGGHCTPPIIIRSRMP
jgi:hypothetical protein